MNIDYIKRNYASEEEIGEIKGTIKTVEGLVNNLKDKIEEYEIMKELLMSYNDYQPMYEDGEWIIKSSMRFYKDNDGLLYADKRKLIIANDILDKCGIEHEIQEFDYYYSLDSKINVKERNLVNKSIELENKYKIKNYKK